MNKLNRGVCRTAPSTPGLLIMQIAQTHVYLMTTIVIISVVMEESQLNSGIANTMVPAQLDKYIEFEVNTIKIEVKLIALV